MDDTITVGGDFTANNLIARDRVKARNLESGTSLPTGPNILEASIFQDETEGKIFVRQKGEWQEFAIVNGMVPVGTVIMSLEKPEVMELKGWVALNGQTITEATHPRLFTIDALLRFVTSGTPEASDRVMSLPNLAGLFPMVSFGNVGVTTSADDAERSAPRHQHGVADHGEHATPPAQRHIGRWRCWERKRNCRTQR